jgi:hypothetical protein
MAISNKPSAVLNTQEPKRYHRLYIMYCSKAETTDIAMMQGFEFVCDKLKASVENLFLSRLNKFLKQKRITVIILMKAYK